MSSVYVVRMQGPGEGKEIKRVEDSMKQKNSSEDGPQSNQRLNFTNHFNMEAIANDLEEAIYSKNYELLKDTVSSLLIMNGELGSRLDLTLLFKALEVFSDAGHFGCL